MNKLFSISALLNPMINKITDEEVFVLMSTPFSLLVKVTT